MGYDPYISPNQAVVSGSVAADGENTTDAPSGRKVKGQLVPGTAETKKSASQSSGGGGGAGSSQATASAQSTESTESTASKAESDTKSTQAKGK